MDVLAALGLVGNIMQFIDFGIKSAKSVREIYKSVDGSLRSLSELEEEAISQARLFEPRSLKEQNDPRLTQLVEICISTSNELVELLGSCRVDPQKNRLLEAASKSFKAHHVKSRIKEMERKLLKARDDVCTRLIVLLSQQQSELGSKLTDISRLAATANNETQHVLETAVAKLTHEIHASAWKNKNDDAFSSFVQELKGFIAHTQDTERAVAILKALYFKQLGERQSEVCEAHRRTFEWIFDLQKNNFSSWLQSKNGIYWIKGKPGSGKSTLMKFLINHEVTTRLLQDWSGGKELAVIGHFFWNAGTKLQKSRIGLLRSLLFQILSQFPGLIPEVLPDRWAKQLYGAKSQLWLAGRGWTWDELSSPFEKLAALKNLPMKLCLFIDGLDEYDGDHVELIEVLRTISKSPDIKICASSRPWFDFIDAFGHQGWKLCVQDLTAEDILLYVKDNLQEDPRFQKLKLQDETATLELVEEIRTKSCGVFLWVYLVVRSLLRGLRNIDRIPDLRRRLYELPSELEKYFGLMLNSVEKVYQQTTARIFKVLIAAGGSLPVLAFHFLDQEESRPGYALRDFAPIHLEHFDAMRDEKKRQLHAHCRDLLWITTQDPAEGVLRDKVGFLHRTVMDFLRTKDMDVILSARAGEGFRPAGSLSMIYLALLKTHTRSRSTLSSKSRRMETNSSLVLGVIHYALQSEREDEIAQVLILDELESYSERRPLDWHIISGSQECCNFLEYTVRAGLQLYITRKMRVPDSDQTSIACEILRHALKARFVIDQNVEFNSRRKREVDLSMLRFLLGLGIDPNEQCPGNDKSVWTEFLLLLSTNFPRGHMGTGLWRNPWRSHVWLKNWYEACELLISHGARDRMRVNDTVPAAGGILQRKKVTCLYALDLIRQVFTPEQANALQQRYVGMELQKPVQTTAWTRFLPFYRA